MVKYNSDFAISETAFFDSLIMNFISKEFSISKIKYQINYKWILVKDLIEIKNVNFDSIQIFLNKGIRFLMQKGNPNLYSRICISESNSRELNLFKDELEKKYVDQIVYGQICEDIDKGLQNTDEIKYWKIFEREISSYVQVLGNPNYLEGAPGMDMIEKEYINLESLPGHSHQMNNYVGSDNLWFGSCWQMYFSPVYYKYIPKPLWDDYNDCFEHIVFENGLRKITLFENIEDYDLPENRAKQWAFRRALGIDSIAHEVCPRLNRQQIDPENLPVLITKKNCQIGQTRVTRFLNSNNQLIGSDKAVKVEIKEYLDDGVTVVYECLQDL